jgi:hypothetical protein
MSIRRVGPVLLKPPFIPSMSPGFSPAREQGDTGWVTCILVFKPSTYADLSIGKSMRDPKIWY